MIKNPEITLKDELNELRELYKLSLTIQENPYIRYSLERAIERLEKLTSSSHIEIKNIFRR